MVELHGLAPLIVENEFQMKNKTAPTPAQPTEIGCAILMVFGALFGLRQCTEEDPPTQKEIAAQVAEAAEDRRKGFHCLSAWDGSHSGIVQHVKAGLRDPDSFEHVDTLITPVNPTTGKHGVNMTFRAANGFGGINVGRAVGEVDPITCNASNLLVDG